MILWEKVNRILLANHAVDFRKSVNGLCIMIQEEYEENPGNGDVYVFYNKRRTSLKVLYYDVNGFMLLYKRLDKGRYKVDQNSEERKELDDQMLKWLLAGLDFEILSTVPTPYTHYG